MVMEYLELGARFWQIQLNGSKTITKYGKIGAKGRTIQKTHSSEKEVSLRVLVVLYLL